MTGRTHDLAGITTLTTYLTFAPLTDISLATAVVAFALALAGALTPDIDQPTAPLWHKIPAGSIIGRVISPLLGNHRMVSHSLVGLGLFAWIVRQVLLYSQKFLIIDVNLVWWAFIFGYVSHLVMDSITKEGVPWFFPIPVRLGFPPLKFLRFTTGAWGEKLLVFPGLLLLNGYLIYTHYLKFIDFFTHHLIR